MLRSIGQKGKKLYSSVLLLMKVHGQYMNGLWLIHNS